MKKAEQRAINAKVEHELDMYTSLTHPEDAIKIGRLRTCQATVYETNRYLVLVSYKTVVALIKLEDMTLYDFSRYVYGYTATTAQHIAKFANEYDVTASDRYTWKEVR